MRAGVGSKASPMEPAPPAPTLDLATIAEAAVPLLRRVHERIRQAVLEACASTADLAAVAADGPGDTIYAVDKVSEAVLVEALEPLARRYPLRLVAEGIEGDCVLPRGTGQPPVLRVIVDPIDGTRGLMYQKRPAWILTGVAVEKAEATRLDDVFVAVQTEIPLLKQHLTDQLWATNLGGEKRAAAERQNLVTGERQPLPLTPSRAPTLSHGFATIVRFFPGARDALGGFDEDLMKQVVAPPEAGKALCFEDQYLSTGGQLYEVIMGHDRFIADLRPLFAAAMARRGQPHPLCCHPYDICTALIAEAAGVIVESPTGDRLNPPLDLATDVAWVAYANNVLKDHISARLASLLPRWIER